MSESQHEAVNMDPIRQDILAGARELFIHYGYKKTTMEDIARKIGKSKSALYYYFKTKEEIFEAMAQEDLAKQQQVAVEMMNKETTVQDRFRAFVVSMFSHVLNNTRQYTIFKAEVMENPLLIMNITEKRNAYMEAFLKDLVLYGIRRGEVKELTHEQIEIWAKAMNVALKAIGSHLFLGSDQEKFKGHLDFIANSFFSGICQAGGN